MVVNVRTRLDDRIKIVLKMTLNVKNLLLSINASSIPNIKQVIYFGVTISSNLSIGSRLDSFFVSMSPRHAKSFY